MDGFPVTMMSQETHPEMFERVNVLKGATGFMYGFGEPGGIVNYVIKKPLDENCTEFTLGYRLNLVNEKGSTAVRDTRISRQVIGLGLDAKLSPDITVYGNLVYGRRKLKNTSSSGFNLRNIKDDLPSPVDSADLQARTSNGLIDGRSLFAQLGIKWQIAEKWHLQTDYVYQRVPAILYHLHFTY